MHRGDTFLNAEIQSDVVARLGAEPLEHRADTPQRGSFDRDVARYSISPREDSKLTL